MAKNELTKKDFDRIIPPKDKKEAIEESERFEKEYEINRQIFEKMMDELKKLAEELKELNE